MTNSIAPLFTKVQNFEITPAAQIGKQKYKFGCIEKMVVTLPKVKTTFSGCKYNKISVTSTPELTAWINNLEGILKNDPSGPYDVVPLVKSSSEFPDEIRLKFPPTSVLVNAVDNTEVDPNDLRRNTLIVPIVKFSYYINGRKIGLIATMLKGLVYEKQVEQVEFEADL